MPELEIDFILREVRRMVGLEGPTALEKLKGKEGSDPYRILIGTILSQRTRDENTTKAVENLFSRFGSVEEVADADVETLETLIRPTGFYRVKAARIKEVSRILLGKYGGKVPEDMDELLSLPSVGRKTANCVLVYGFGKPAIPVDTHVHRIANRLGLVRSKRPEETEGQLARGVDKKYWLELNDLFVRFGQSVCKPIRPLCEKCSLNSICAYYLSIYLSEPKEGTQKGSQGIPSNS